MVEQVTFNITIAPVIAAVRGHGAELALWHSWGIEDYSFRLEVGRFRPPPSADVIVIVRSGELSSFRVVTPYGSDSPVIISYSTMESLFGALEGFYRDESLNTSASYDPVYGFPTFISAYTGPLEVEAAIYISEFTPLNTPAAPAEPVISMAVTHPMGGSADYYDIYADGFVLATSERNMRIITPGHHGTRLWQTGQLAGEELLGLIGFFTQSGFLGLEDTSVFPGLPLESGPPGGFAMGDSFYSFTFNYGSIYKEVSASAYLKAEDMPQPLYNILAAVSNIKLNGLGEEPVY
jgi:hypothetical protein